MLGRGLLSDDTEHAAMTAQALLAAPEDPARFARSLAWRLRGWLALLPAGVGWGTLRAIVKLWLGFSPQRSGVVSAGNGPAMRAAVLGACLSEQPELLRSVTLASTRLTHREARAEEGALAIALAARHAVRGPVDAPALLVELRSVLSGSELRASLGQVEAHLRRETTPEELAAALGLSRGVSGYINHTVPMALFCWLRYPGDFRRAVEEVILLGGDTDTTAAIVGGLAGAALGASAIPASWLAGLRDWPRSVAWLGALAARLAKQFPSAGKALRTRPLPLFWPLLLVRNAAFMAVVLAHGLRRLLPPY